MLRRPLHTFPRVPPLACLLGWCAVKQGGGVHLVHPHFVLTAALWVSHCDSQLPQEAAGLTKFRDLPRDCRLRKCWEDIKGACSGATTSWGRLQAHSRTA